MPSRKTENIVHAGKGYTIYPGDVPWIATYTESARDDVLVWSDGHYGYPRFPSMKDVGGAFRVAYRRVQNGATHVGAIQGGTVYAEYRYDGSVFTGWPLYNGLTCDWVDFSNLGSTAYSKMKPDKPAMNGLNAIYELKDLPGMLQQRFLAQNLHEIGDYYLALKFGWEALLKDVVSFVVTQRQAQEILKQLLRDEGRPVKRSITLNDTSDETYSAEGYGNYLYPSFVTYFYADGGSFRNIGRFNRKTWARARFRYWLPGGPRDVEWTNSMLRRIFGFKPTPAVVYRAIPWTWLAAWFTNVGDMIDNLETSLVDRLAADYYYLMENREMSVESTCNSTFFRAETLERVPATATAKFQLGHKTRLKGDPFGYGTPENSLSGVQLSIMGALGLSRLR